ncbi:MAG: zinc ribbon domain-containing protein [Candidatus Omnitrophota bacterium]|nr:zinc ribbon domain-containing protein [Candidatus Omnitrophota bacterium]
MSYEGKVYPGEHEAFLSEEVYNQAQVLLKLNKRERGVSKNKKFDGILSRLFRCACCHASMCHGYAKKKNNAYRYYTCLTALKRNRKDCPIKSVSASVIENKCLDILRYISSDERLEKERWKALNLEEQITALRSLVRQINYDGQKGKLYIELTHDSHKHEFDLPLAALKSRLRTTGEPNLEQEPPIRRQLLLAHQIQQMLDKGQAKDLNQLAGWLGVSKTRLDQITNLLYLCPKIQEEIINGDRLQIERIGERTIRPLSVEIDWQQQISAWKKLLSSETLSA